MTVGGQCRSVYVAEKVEMILQSTVSSLSSLLLQERGDKTERGGLTQ